MKTTQCQNSDATRIRPTINHDAAVAIMYAASEGAVQYLYEQGDVDGERLADALRIGSRLMQETMPPDASPWEEGTA
ncbi:MAG TPA: hypothetical protein VHI13_15215 [Candidatus Kapabacteria bacterium]|nr:hypothetical protein [Candidatus Kapabacteria bacterium]